MSVTNLFRRDRSTTPRRLTRDDLRWRADILGDALDAAGQELDPGKVIRAGQVIGKIHERTALAGSHTVVALAGATGSGKSSLFNALVGERVAESGPRRPTTAKASAAVWGEEPANELLDWLSVGTRHNVKAAAGELDGLVLLDLPDIDSRELRHRDEADRVLELADIFVWVTDPQKYADARLHHDYVAQMKHHDTVMIAVLNHADTLRRGTVQQVVTDLGTLLENDGVQGVDVIPTSARTGDGVEELRARLAKAVQLRNATEERLLGDIRTIAEDLRTTGVADSEPDIEVSADSSLVGALARAAGVPAVLNAVEADYRRQAAKAAGWPFTRWFQAARPDPLRRLRLDREGDQAAGTDIRAVLGRSSLPKATPAARSSVDLATREIADRAGQGLPRRWAEAALRAAGGGSQDAGLADALDQAVMGTSLRARDPLWWSVFNAMQWIFALATVLGFGWLAVLALAEGLLRLPIGDPMPVPGTLVPLPLALAVLGVLSGWLLSWLAKSLAVAGAKARRREISGRLHSSIQQVADEEVVAPVREVLDRHRKTRERLDSARS